MRLVRYIAEWLDLWLDYRARLSMMKYNKVSS